MSPVLHELELPARLSNEDGLGYCIASSAHSKVCRLLVSWNLTSSAQDADM